jgi:hypothetical protein
MRDDFWCELERKGHPGVLTRIDETHPGDFYAAVNERFQRGLVLFSSNELPAVPEMENLDIQSSQLPDGTWRNCLWVTDTALYDLFTVLVSDILGSSRAMPVEGMAQYVAARVTHWHSLLESGGGGPALFQLRGLVAELEVLRRLIALVGPLQAVESWHGPLGGTQDFILSNARLETKAIGFSARRIKINSAEQLDAGEHVLRLITIAVADSLPGADGSVTIAEFVALIFKSLASSSDACEAFRKRLGFVGVGDSSETRHRFRLGAVRVYAVKDTFPRITPTMLSEGVDSVSYELRIASLAEFETAWGDWFGS